MKNYVQRGRVINVPAPTGGVVGGDVIIINDLIGVVAKTTPETELVSVNVEGVFSLPTGGATIPLGTNVGWDAGASKVVAGGGVAIGYTTTEATAADATVEVKFNNG